MNTARMAILGVASVAGICCVGVLAHGLAGAKPPPPKVIVQAAPVQPTVHVLVAKRELAVGDRIQGADMGWQGWPADALNPAFTTDGAAAAAAAPQGQFGRAAGTIADAAKASLSNPADGPGSSFVGAIVRERISMNEPLIASKVVKAGGSGVMAVTLEPGMRAVALPLTAESAAGGFVLPGDHVDVILTRQLDASATPGAPAHGSSASTVMRNVRVLAVDQNMGVAPQKGGSTSAAAIGATATVEATPAQAEYLVLAKASGTLTLALRSYADAAGGAQIGSLGGPSGAGPTVRVFRTSTPTAVTVAR